MTLFRDTYRMESARHPRWDYTSAGWYFATICTRDRRCVLGDVVADDVTLSPAGAIVAEEWLKTEELRRDVELDEWVVMPNHLHGIIAIGRAKAQSAPTALVETPRRGVSVGLASGSLGAIVGQFKSACTKRIRQSVDPGFGWQERFWDHIIRSDKALNAVREYILNNPRSWDLDRDNPQARR